jgi:hypothetical protein
MQIQSAFIGTNTLSGQFAASRADCQGGALECGARTIGQPRIADNPAEGEAGRLPAVKQLSSRLDVDFVNTTCDARHGRVRAFSPCRCHELPSHSESEDDGSMNAGP